MFDIDKSLKKMVGNTRVRGGPKDWDGDGVPNKKDCQPRNTMRQDKLFGPNNEFKPVNVKLPGGQSVIRPNNNPSISSGDSYPEVRICEGKCSGMTGIVLKHHKNKKKPLQVYVDETGKTEYFDNEEVQRLIDWY